MEASSLYSSSQSSGLKSWESIKSSLWTDFIFLTLFYSDDCFDLSPFLFLTELTTEILLAISKEASLPPRGLLAFSLLEFKTCYSLRIALSCLIRVFSVVSMSSPGNFYNMAFTSPLLRALLAQFNSAVVSISYLSLVFSKVRASCVFL